MTLKTSLTVTSVGCNLSSILSFASYLPVSGSCVERYMAQMLLEHPEPITGIILFYCMYGKTVSESVRANIVHLAGFRVYQFR